jgi:hypothetical protein
VIDALDFYGLSKDDFMENMRELQVDNNNLVDGDDDDDDDDGNDVE